MKIGILCFPGSNCEKDIAGALFEVFTLKSDILWHKEPIQDKYDLLVLPGGFSYGDYLRPGSIARFAIAMESLKEHITQGRAVLGICNGFQILCEAGFLPGALILNKELKHICCDIKLSSNAKNKMTSSLNTQDTYTIPVSHSEGNYYVNEELLKEMKDQNQIAFTYQENPNGSIANIAGITNNSMRILGMMPHPERAVNTLNGKLDGKAVLQSILNSL